MKEDAPVPETVPAKRRQLRDALDLWLAVWASRDDLTPSERRRVEEERERRKAQRKRGMVVAIGFLIGKEGLTPAQANVFATYVGAHRPDAVYVGDIPASVARRLGAVVVLDDMQAVVRNADLVLAAPKHAREPASGEAGVWAGIRYARHRKVPVRVVVPNGEEV